jgi:hypothetical protein
VFVALTDGLLAMMAQELILEAASELGGAAAVKSLHKGVLNCRLVTCFKPTLEDRVFVLEHWGSSCKIQGSVAFRHGFRQMVVTITHLHIGKSAPIITQFTRIVEQEEPIQFND